MYTEKTDYFRAGEEYMIHIYTWLLFLSACMTHLVSCVAYDVERQEAIRMPRRKRGVTITTQPAWRTFGHTNQTNTNASALIATVIIRTGSPLNPGPLTFSICTPNPEEALPDGIGATLFIKEKNVFTTRKEERLIPLQKQFIAQGIVDRKKKTITFLMPHKIVSREEFYIIMSFPKKHTASAEKYVISHHSQNI